MPSSILKLLFALLISTQSLVAYGETIRKSLSSVLTYIPELELLESRYGRNTVVLKGSNDPYTGPSSAFGRMLLLRAHLLTDISLMAQELIIVNLQMKSLMENLRLTIQTELNTVLLT